MGNTKKRDDYLVLQWLDVVRKFMLGGTEVTATAAELNALDGITATVDELNLNDLSAVGALMKVKKISISATPTGAEQDTGWDVPAEAVVYDVFLRVRTPEATGGTKTMDIGLKSSEAGGDADGFAIALSCATAGLHRPGVVTTAGGNETYVSDFSRGAFLRQGVPLAGANVVGDEGSYYEKPHLTPSVTAKSVTFTAKSNDWAEFRGDIYIVYAELS